MCYEKQCCLDLCYWTWKESYKNVDLECKVIIYSWPIIYEMCFLYVLMIYYKSKLEGS